MKKYFAALAVIGLLFWAQEAVASISLVNVNSASNNAAGTSLSSTLNVATSGLILASCGHGTTFVSPTNVTDTIGNTFTSFAVASNSNAGAITGYYSFSIGGATTDTISCNFASSVGGRAINLLQYSGTVSNPLDATAKNGNTTSAGTFSAGPFTTTQANEVIVAMGGAGSSVSNLAAGAGYTMEVTSTRGSNSEMGAED
jgi:hypothetical protein